ncbi:MAG: peptidoglycan glycosyltransferase [Clostridia bacterium]|nr:peptidoglycan glycosyltransferase [Clostridia bacterium]
MNSNRKIIRVLIVVSALFLALLTYLLYFNMFEAESVATNPYNRRQWDDEKYVTRGTIYDQDGIVLAETVEDGVSIKREYPYGRLYSHVIGYCSRVYGKSLLEREFDSELLGKGDIGIFQGDKKKGFDLNLTIKNSLQKYAYEQLRGKRGAIVALEPKTGKILAMVSLPDFEPQAESLEKNWNSIVEDESAPLVARAFSGLYPPGSTYKIVTAAVAFENGLSGQVFEDTGGFLKGELKVENFGNKKYGEISLERGFEVSSNQVFCTVGYELGSEKLLEISERFGVNKDINFDIDASNSRIEYKKMTDEDSALVAIGQGQLLVTPIHMAMICASVANNGNMMTPYVVDSVTKNETVIQKARPKIFAQPISAECADYLKELMVNVVKNGTGSRAAIYGIDVAGKTGTAENESEKDHAWFVGFAPADEPEIAVAVVLENSGTSGGDSAAPIAGNIMRKYLEK